MTEQSEAKRDGSKLQKNSGRGKHAKGDAVLGPFLIDYKEYASSFSVSIENWAKLCTDAYKAGRKIPAFKLVLGTGNQKVRVWVVPEYIMDDYLKLNEKRDIIDVQE